MKKIGVTIIALVLTIAVFVAPFSASAETKPTPTVIGVNANLIDTSNTVVNSTSTVFTYLYELDVILDTDYIGTVSGVVTYKTTESTTSYNSPFTKSINGNHFVISIIVNSSARYSGNGPLSTYSCSISSSNVVANSSYSFPIESMNFISSMDSYGFVPESFNTIDYSVYPLYKLNTNDEFLIATVNPANDKANDYTLIFGVNRNVYNATSFDNVLSHESTNAYSNYTFEYIETLYRNNLAPFSIVKAHLYSNDSQTQTVRFKAKQDITFMPVYANYSALNNLSTDFALRFNLSNRLIDALESFNTTSPESESIIDSNDSMTSSLNSSVTDMHSLETSFQDNMSNAMTDIDFNSSILDNNTLASGMNWVRTQYNRMTNNTVFGTLIQYSLLFGLGLLVLGRFRK